MLGSDVAAELARRAIPFDAPNLEELDITSPASVSTYLRWPKRWAWCINCAAYTAVDKAEEDSDTAYAVNAIGVAYLAGACSILQTRVLHISTDFVFDGTKDEPYVESDPTNPLGEYAKSKLAGEESALHYGGTVCRTSWLFGPNGPSFPRTMIRAWKAGKNLRVVADQIGSPTYTGELARVLVDMIELESLEGGIYHISGEEFMSWHRLAERAIISYKKLVGDETDLSIEPIRTEDWPTPAARPAYSVLNTSRYKSLGVKHMEPLEQSLRSFIKRLPAEL